MSRRKFEDTIDEKIARSEETVARLKADYDDELARLKALKSEKEQFQQDAILKMVKKSKRSYEEIREFLLRA